MTAAKSKSQHLGYVRVSSVSQNTERQLDGLELERIFEDKVSGKNMNRPQLQELLRYARHGDTVYVHSLDRLGRNLDDLRSLVNQLTDKGVTVTFVKENLTFTSDKSNPLQELMFNIMASFAQFERELIRERQREGIAIAKANGVYRGRKREMTPERVSEINERIAAGEPKARVAKDMGISRDTLYRYTRD
jgi:DNA invertase Pin-like site-specific DNA recombinase